MNPQAFIRLSIGSLGLRLPEPSLDAANSGGHTFSSSFSCEIRLRGFPAQTTSVPLLSSPEATPDAQNIASSFYLKESDLKALLVPGCFYTPQACLEVVVFTGRKGYNCGVGIKRRQIGLFKLAVGSEWGEGKSAVLFSGWIGIGKHKQESGKPGAELHLRVKIDPDPRYVFQFEDVTGFSPQIVQLQGTIRQPIFSCRFIRDRVSPVDPLSTCGDQELERRERKGWKVTIHDLSGSAVAAAFIATPFVPSTGHDWVAKSNPGAWLIVRPDAFAPVSWHPWGKLEAWRERGNGRDSVCCQFRLLSEPSEWGIVSRTLISAEKGGEFFINTEQQASTSVPLGPSPHGSGDYSSMGPARGFVMSCRVRGEGRSSKPSVQLAMRHITCVEDAAVFMALAAAVDLSIEACRPFPRGMRKMTASQNPF